MKPHYVYYLYTADKEDRLMEVGRSINPAKRRRIKELKHGVAFRMLTSAPIESLSCARAYELAEIDALQPPFNVCRISSPGNYGKHHTTAAKARISAAHKGVPLSPQHCRSNMLQASKRFPSR